MFTRQQLRVLRRILYRELASADALGKPRPPDVADAYTAVCRADDGTHAVVERAPWRPVAGDLLPPETAAGATADAETIGTQEAADLLGVSERHVRGRLAADLDGWREGYAWRFHRSTVERYATERNTP